jgi:hypothetical protein
MKLTITVRPKNSVYGDRYSLNPEDHEIMYRDIIREMERVGLDVGKEIVKPNGQSAKVEKIEMFPQKFAMYVVIAGEDLDARQIIKLLDSKVLTIR